MKFLGCFVFALIALFAVVSARNTTWGARNWNDQVIFRQNIEIRGSNAYPRPSFNLTFPARGAGNTRKISYIQVIDRNRFGSGGVASLYHGGVGYKNVTILLKAEAMTGLNVTAQIWGR